MYGGRLGSGSGGRGRGDGGRLGSGSGSRGRGDGGRLGSGSGGRGRGDGGRLGSCSGGRGRGDVQSLIVQSLIAVCTPSASPNPTTCHRRLIRGSIVTMSRAETRSHSPDPMISLPSKWSINYRSSSHSHWRPRVLNLGTSTNSSGVIDPCGIGTKERSETPPFWIKRCCKSRGTPAMVLSSRLTPSLKQSRALRTKYSSIVNS